LVCLCCDALVVAPLAPVNHVVFAGIAQFFPALIDADVAGDAEQPADECGDFVPLGIFDLVFVDDGVVKNGRGGPEAIDGLHELFIVYFVFDVVQAWSLIRFFKLNGAVGASDRGVLVGVPVNFRDWRLHHEGWWIWWSLVWSCCQRRAAVAEEES
jgi:hypothetical protein